MLISFGFYCFIGSFLCYLIKVERKLFQLYFKLLIGVSFIRFLRAYKSNLTLTQWILILSLKLGFILLIVDNNLNIIIIEVIINLIY